MLTNSTIREAVKLWCQNKRDNVILQYGHISYWDTSHVTDMNSLFANSSINDNLDNVTTMMLVMSLQ